MTNSLAECIRYPLSAAQHRLWLIAQFDPTSCAYNNAHLIRFTGPLERSRLSAALQTVIKRHETLRMRFVHADGPGSDVCAVVDADCPIDVAQSDLSDAMHTSDTDRAASEERWVGELARQPFDLQTGPLIRAGLLHTGPENHVLAIVLHHIISDRWSFGVLMRELAAIYFADGEPEPCLLTPIVTTYGQCSRAQTQNDGANEAQLDYWRTVLAPQRTALELPIDRAPTAAPTNGGGVVHRTITRDLAQRLTQLGAQHKATPFMTYLAAFFVLLQRSTGQTDLLIGTPVAGRSRIEREPLIGLFVNTLPVRIEALPSRRFTEILATVRRATLDLLAHADVPFDRLVREGLTDRDGTRNPFFNVLFNFHNTPFVQRWPDGLSVVTEDIDTGTSRIDLALTLRPEPDGRLTVRLEFSSDLFNRTTIEAFVAHFCVALESIARSPDVPIAELPIAEFSEIEMLVRDWSRSDNVDSMVADDGQSLNELVVRAVGRHPDNVALVEAGSAPITYAELDRRANRLAHALREQGVGRDVCVGIFLNRSVDAVVGMLATLKAGGAYVPLDPAYPAGRTAAMLEHAGVATVVSRRADRRRTELHGVATIGVDDPSLQRFDTFPPPAANADPDRLAYVIFTSGSTGKPKAVGITHRCVVAFLTRAPYLRWMPTDAFLFHAALTFDASMLMWSALIHGGRVAIVPAGPFSLIEFAEHLRNNAITMLDVSPALFHELVEERIDALRDLRQCTVGGDVLSSTHSAQFVHQVPGCRLFNCYGPTETTVAACYHEVMPGANARQAVPIGRPLGDARIYILDDLEKPVPIGVAGELWIGGPGVARGYINDPSLTAQRFVGDPFAKTPGARMYRTGDRARWLADGNVQFLGRLDAQVKIRGFRIEPAEIECALLEHPAIRQAAIAVRGDGAARALVAFVEAREAGFDVTTLRPFLQARLPAHSIPSRFAVLEALPKTSSGKLDRGALPDLAALPQTAAGKSATSELEQRLIGMWKTLLQVEVVGIEDDFFALGGHSLIAARLISEIEREFQTSLPLAVLFERPTIAHLARALQNDPGNLNRSPIVALNPNGEAQPFFFLHGSFAGGGYYCLKLAQRLGANQPLLAMRPHGVAGGHLPSTLEAVAEECISTLKAAQPIGPYLLGGFCSGGLVAFEMARQLVARGDRVDNVILIDAPNAEPRLRKIVERIALLGRCFAISRLARTNQRAKLCRLLRTAGGVLRTHGKRGLLQRSGAKLRATFDRRRAIDSPPRVSVSTPDIVAAWSRLGLGYVPRRYTGPITVLLSDEYRRRSDVHADQWMAIAPRTKMDHVPGEHLTCITDHIDVVAKQIAQALEPTIARSCRD